MSRKLTRITAFESPLEIQRWQISSSHGSFQSPLSTWDKVSGHHGWLAGANLHGGESWLCTTLPRPSHMGDWRLIMARIYTMETDTGNIKPQKLLGKHLHSPMCCLPWFLFCQASQHLFSRSPLQILAWDTYLGSVGIQHFHVLQFPQTLTVVEDGCFVVPLDIGLVPLFLQGCENKRQAVSPHQMSGGPSRLQVFHFNTLPLVFFCSYLRSNFSK